MTTYGLYDPDQNRSDYDHDPTYYVRHGLVLAVTGWDGPSPIVTLDQFGAFIEAQAGNDRNGNWGQVLAVATADAGRVMVYMSGDSCWQAMDAEVWPTDGMTYSEVLDLLGPEDSAWTPGDGGCYRLADSDDWSMWVEVSGE